MAFTDIIKSLGDYGAPNRINYKPYDFQKIQVLAGVPPAPIHGLDFVIAYHNNPQSKLFGCLTGNGAFVANRNHRGIIEFGLQSDCVSAAVLQMLDFTGIPIPLAIIDLTTTGFSSVVASACRRVGTPRFRRRANPELQIYTFEAERLLISIGPRQTV